MSVIPLSLPLPDCDPPFLFNHWLASSPDRRPFPHWFDQVSLGLTNSCISIKPFASGLFITLMVEGVHSSEMLV
jgi:hypothetical protein